jgi:serine/threonine protein kinase
MWAAHRPNVAFRRPASCPSLRVPSVRPAADYQKQAEIGQGTFGVVHKAIQNATGRVVAIKKLRTRRTKAGIELATLREIMLLQEPGPPPEPQPHGTLPCLGPHPIPSEPCMIPPQEIRHTNVVELVEVYCHNGSISLVFEFCTADLEAVIKDSSQAARPCVASCLHPPHGPSFQPPTPIWSRRNRATRAASLHLSPMPPPRHRRTGARYADDPSPHARDPPRPGALPRQLGAAP